MKRIIISIEPIPESNTNEQLHWISQALGLFNERDKEKSCHRIFVELIKAKKDNNLLSCQELADKSNLSRATVLHHLDKLTESNIVMERDHEFELVDENLNSIILRLKKEMNDFMEEMEKISRKLDEELGF
ncbi:helix-turn-helix transcriptional regulator [Candidatus Woesearchaeota archaeon]|nr:helix-turn-helix transcriptional regulator [Candidatus Woesearchaeota archaeon]